MNWIKHRYVCSGYERLVSMDRQLPAFTLIELLLVIALLVILAALFLPAMNKARERARTNDCNENLRQIGTAMRLFAGDHNERYPESGGIIYWGGRDRETQEASWMEQIATFIENTNVFNCPGNAELSAEFRGPFNYFNGCNVALATTKGFAPVNSAALLFPWAFVLGGDTAGAPAYCAGSQFDLRDADKDDYTHNCVGGAGDDSVTEYWRIHVGGQNVLFADGHSEWYRGYMADEMTFAYNRLTNWADPGRH